MSSTRQTAGNGGLRLSEKSHGTFPTENCMTDKGSISWVKVTPSVIRSVIFKAHVPRNNESSFNRAVRGQRSSARLALRRFFREAETAGNGGLSLHLKRLRRVAAQSEPPLNGAGARSRGDPLLFHLPGQLNCPGIKVLARGPKRLAPTPSGQPHGFYAPNSSGGSLRNPNLHSMASAMRRQAKPSP